MSIISKINQLVKNAKQYNQYRSIRTLIDWFNGNYTTMVHKAGSTNSFYVDIIDSDSKILICKIRVSDHSQVYDSCNLYIIAPMNLDVYVLNIGDNKIPMVFKRKDLFKFLSSYIDIERVQVLSKKCKTVASAVKEIVLEEKTENAQEKIVEEDDTVDVSEIDLKPYEDRTYLRMNWDSYWNTYMIKAFPKLKNLTEGRYNTIRDVYCRNGLVNVSLYDLNNRFTTIYKRHDGDYGKFITAFQQCGKSWSIINQKTNENETIDFAIRENRERKWKIFAELHIEDKFEWFLCSTGEIKSMLHTGYCHPNTDALSVEELDNILMECINNEEGYLNAAIAFKERIMSMVPNKTKEEVEAEEKIEVDDKLADSIISDIDSLQINAQLAEQVDDFDKMTDKQKQIIQDLVDHYIPIDIIVSTINIANMNGRYTNRMQSVANRLLAENMAAGDGTTN